MATVVQTLTITCASAAEQATANVAVAAWAAANPGTVIKSVTLTNKAPWTVTVTFPSGTWTPPVVN